MSPLQTYRALCLEFALKVVQREASLELREKRAETAIGSERGANVQTVQETVHFRGEVRKE